jgi:hypothetical protein
VAIKAETCADDLSAPAEFETLYEEGDLTGLVAQPQ